MDIDVMVAARYGARGTGAVFAKIAFEGFILNHRSIITI